MASHLFVNITTDEQKGNFVVLVQLQFGRQGGHWGQKIEFLTQKGPFWTISARKWPAEQPNRHLLENRRYPELS